MYRFLVYLCLVALHMGSSSVQAATVPVDGEVLFDSSYENMIYEMPAPCKGQNLCFDEGNEYPHDKIENLLTQMPLLLDSKIRTSFSFREGDDASGNTDCPANTTFINKPIYYMLDENDVVRVVVQAPLFQQVYSVKWCQYPGQITRDTPHFLKGSQILEMYKVECVNTYLDSDFIVLSNGDYGQRLELARPKDGIPVYCRCRYSEIERD